MRILLFDIETVANLAWVWGKYQQDVIAYQKEWELLCISYKWLNEKKVYFEKRQKTDKNLVKTLHHLFKEADVLIAHNGDNFDVKKAKTRMIFYGFSPPKILKTIDTKKIAKNKFGFNSNSLNDVAKYLKLGTKVQHTGFSLWQDCLKNDKKAWALMKKYNIQDVLLLEMVYKKLLPWIENHPSVAKFLRRVGCPNCGGEDIVKRGIRANTASLQQQWNCNLCSSWFLTSIKKI